MKPLAEPPEIAAEAGLRYASDTEPGIRRRRCGKGFTYVDPDGRTVRDDAARERIAALAIPPAWTDVWICTDPDGHLQCTGRDDRDRKQYLYHPAWVEARDRAKFERLARFGEALPALRERVAADLRRRGMPREKALATVVRLLETTCLRVGNQEYARDNGTFGLTTLRRRHVEISGSRIRFRFTGKGGKQVEVDVSDRRLARLVRQCDEVRGWELFRYLDEHGEPHTVDSGEINDYIREATGGPFTAKDFRTWMASVHALVALLEREVDENADERELDAAALEAIDEVAELLHNTRAVCRNSYIHPSLLDAFREGWLREAVADLDEADHEGLDEPERALLATLRAARRQRRRSKRSKRAVTTPAQRD